MSGLNINLGKSEIFNVRVVPYIDCLDWILGCKKGTLPTSYLGLPLGAKLKSKEVWNPVVERITWRLKFWKAKLLSKGGHLILLKATLASIPNYYLSFFTIPGSIANKMEALFHKFLWNDNEDSHRYHLLDWKSICKPRCDGGLGLRSIKDHNEALFVKWLWRFGV